MQSIYINFTRTLNIPRKLTSFDQGHEHLSSYFVCHMVHLISIANGDEPHHLGKKIFWHLLLSDRRSNLNLYLCTTLDLHPTQGTPMESISQIVKTF